MKPVFSAARFFLEDQNIDRIEPFGSGNVNDTYLVTLQDDQKKVLQRINPSVFPDPKLVQHNMRLVTHHLDHAIQTSPELRDRFTPLVLFTGETGDAYMDEEGAVWRMANHIPGKTCESIKTASQAEEIGSCLGIFHRLLSTIDSTPLVDTLPGFHNTPAYLNQYDIAWQHYNQKQSSEVQLCHSNIASRRFLATALVNSTGMSRCVIHGDPKVANFVASDDTGRIISLIDLDTVKPGLLLHDIGDALRSCCNPLGESPSEPEQTYFDSKLFASWLKGYACETELLLTNEDKAHIVQAVKVITFELGLRFITDYLEGNHYFKIRYPEHNLIRAQVQFRLIQSIEDQYENLEAIVNKTFC